MGFVTNDVDPAVVDPASVRETFVEGIGQIERIAGNLRVTLYATRDIGDGIKERLVVARIVMPATFIPLAIIQVVNVLLGGEFMSDFVPDIAPN